MRNRVVPIRFLRLFLPGLMAILLIVGVSTSALAQTEKTISIVPGSAFYVGLGGSYNSVNFGTQDVFAVGTSNVFENGYLIATGTAAGPGNVEMNSQSTLAPSVQAGYFRHFRDSDWLWGAKFGYSYLATTSTVQNSIFPQFGSFTDLVTNTTVPFTGNAVVRSYQTIIDNQMALNLFIGRSFEKSFVYFGGGPTLSQTRTNLNGLVGFADINGIHTDVSGAPVDFSSTSWVYGGAGVVGATYFLDSSWFIDLSYTYAMTSNHTSNYSSTFSNPNSPFGTTTGTLVGTTSGKVIAQGVMFTINKAF